MTTIAQVECPSLVVDLGSGTGLSARAWAGRAEQVIGIEPTPEMRAQAELTTTEPHVEYRQRFASDTALLEGSVDIVTCSQSLHWMEPEPTFAEAARVLRPGGVFAAYDYDWPPVVQWEIEEAFEALIDSVGRLRAERGAPRTEWRKDGHLERIRASRRFRFAREFVLHSVESGNAARIVAMARSLGTLEVLRDEGVAEAERALMNLTQVAERVLGQQTVLLHFGYRVRIGVK